MKKSFFAKFLVLVMVLSCFQLTTLPQKTFAATEEYFELKEGQVVSFKNAASGWFMNLQHGTDANGTKVNVYPWDETPPYTQKYKVALGSDGSFNLAVLCAPTRFVDVRRYSKPLAENQGIVIWEEDGDNHKQLRLKKMGDKVAIVFANNPGLCIAPSSATAAETKQSQLIVRKLDASKPEMLWNVCDEKGNPLDICSQSFGFDDIISIIGNAIEHLNDFFTNDQSTSVDHGAEKYYCIKIVHSDSNKVLKRVNDKLMLADYKESDADVDNCFFVYGNNTLFCMTSNDVVSLLGANGSSVGYASWGLKANPVKLIEVEKGVYSIVTNVGDRTFALDVPDGSVERPLQTWEFDPGNKNQHFRIEVVDFLKCKVFSEEAVQRKIDVMLDTYRERYEEIFKDEAKPKETDFGYENKAYFYGYFTSDGRSIGIKTENRNNADYIVRAWFKDAFGFADDYLTKKGFAEYYMYQCCAFASLSADYLFGYQKAWDLKNVPRFTMGKVGKFTWDYLRQNGIKAGDLLYLGVPAGNNGNDAEHFVVVYDVDYTKETITIVHANAHQEGKKEIGCKIIKETLTRQELENGVGKNYTYFGERCTFRRFY